MSEPTIGPAGPGDIETVRTLLLAYQAEFGFGPCFQGFGDEVATLPGAYVPPLGALLLLRDRAGIAGCVALRPLPGRAAGIDGEIKRLYVRPSHRGQGAGRRLAMAVIEAARRAGYARVFLDTMDQMTEARALYASLGFREVPPYYDDPPSGVRCFVLELDDADAGNALARTG